MIRFIPEDAALLQALDSAETFRARYGADVSRHLEVARDVVKQTLDFEKQIDASPPWCGYLSVCDETDTVIGCGGFKGDPSVDRAVEIAYFTFPEFEGRGFATATARGLVDIAQAAGGLRGILAHTLPERNASTRILEKVGFHHAAETVDPDVGPVWRWLLEL